MAQSPRRRCLVTRQELPSSFLINLRPTYMPPTPTSEVSTYKVSSPASLHLLPDRVASPARLKKGKGFWVTCHGQVVDQLGGNRGPHVGVLRQIPYLQVPPNLREIVHAQLLQRVMYELDLLSKRLKVHTRRVKNRASASTSGITKLEFGRSASSSESSDVNGTETETDDVVLERLTVEEANRIVQGGGLGSGRHSELGAKKAMSNVVSLLDITGLDVQDAVEGVSDRKSSEVDIPLVSLDRPSSSERLPPSIASSSPSLTPPALAPAAAATQSQDIPLYPLRNLFPPDQHATLLDMINGLLATEAIHRRRAAFLSSRNNAADQPSTKYAGGQGPQEQLSNVLALHYTPPSTISEGPKTPAVTEKRLGDQRRGEQRYSRGELGADLAISLWRIRCFLGQGWEAKLPGYTRA
ncbi:hypothetical protein IAU59_002317 [Kwoniella sp. CBS 9459]